MVEIHLPEPGTIVRHRVSGQRYVVTRRGVTSVETGVPLPAFHLADYLDTYDVVYTPGEDE